MTYAVNDSIRLASVGLNATGREQDNTGRQAGPTEEWLYKGPVGWGSFFARPGLVLAHPGEPIGF